MYKMEGEAYLINILFTLFSFLALFNNLFNQSRLSLGFLHLGLCAFTFSLGVNIFRVRPSRGGMSGGRRWLLTAAGHRVAALVVSFVRRLVGRQRGIVVDVLASGETVVRSHFRGVSVGVPSRSWI